MKRLSRVPTTLAALALLVPLSLLACSEPPVEEVDEPAVSEYEPPVNTLTEGEVADGWQLLFDGETLDGWRGYGMQGIPAGWTVEDGTIFFSPDAAEADGGQRSDLVTKDEYRDFDFALEWKISPGGNSGLMYRVNEEAGERSYHTGPEMQILDDSAHRDGKNPLTSAGSNYALIAPSEYARVPVGEWNRVRLLVRGNDVEHWLNGERVVSYVLGNEEWEALVAGSKFAQWEGYGRSPRGRLAIQDHGDPVWFRNIRIRPLTDTSAGRDEAND